MDENTKNANVIVEGEASESDEEVEVKQTDLSGDQTSQTDREVKEIQPADVVVSGEASESDEETEVVTKDGEILPLNVNTSEKGDHSDASSPIIPSLPVQARETKPKYNTLLNRKLRERNVALRRHIVDTIHQSYLIAAKDLRQLTTQLQKSHIAIQDVSHHMRNATNDLFHLEDKVDIVSSCFILPDINIPSERMATEQ